MTRFSDFADEPTSLEGDKIKIDDILGQEVEILQYRVLDSKYPKSNSSQCLTIQFRFNGKVMISFTGSNVLIKQMKRYGDKCPFFAKIIKINRYYSLS
jgi:hypothetical protein